MSVLKQTKTVDLSGEGYSGHTAVVRRVGWKVLADAKRITQKEGAELLAAMGWDAIQKTVTANGGEAAVKQQAETDPFIQHDRMTLLSAGVTSWTLPVPLNAEELADLPDESAVALAREIYEMSRPRTEAETKNA